MHARSEDSTSAVLDRELDEEKGTGPSGPRIRCPRCGWSPCQGDRWSCSCGHEWNTFDTGGVCPACLHQWTSTQCLSCARWSPHSDGICSHEIQSHCAKVHSRSVKQRSLRDFRSTT